MKKAAVLLSLFIFVFLVLFILAIFGSVFIAEESGPDTYLMVVVGTIVAAGIISSVIYGMGEIISQLDRSRMNQLDIKKYQKDIINLLNKTNINQ